MIVHSPEPGGGYVCLAFAGDPAAGAPKALVALHAGGPALGLANLLPEGPDGRPLDRILGGAAFVDACNAVVVRVHDDLVAPAAEADGAHVELGSAAPDLRDALTADARQRLERCSGAANQGAGGTHPADRGRWFDFVRAAHAEAAAFDTAELEAWLAGRGWGAADADRLARVRVRPRPPRAWRPQRGARRTPGVGARVRPAVREPPRGGVPRRTPG